MGSRVTYSLAALYAGCILVASGISVIAGYKVKKAAEAEEAYWNSKRQREENAQAT